MVIRLVNLYVVEIINSSYQINEWEDEDGRIFFSYGDIGHIGDITETRVLEGARSLFEARARLMEVMVYLKNKPVDSIFLKQLGEPRDLVPLIGFFKTEEMKRALSDYIKGVPR